VSRRPATPAPRRLPPGCTTGTIRRTGGVRYDLVVDLGAHVGVFALAAAAAGCRVLAVEASQANARLLEASAARNGFEHLRIVQAAASDQRRRLAFCPEGA